MKESNFIQWMVRLIKKDQHLFEQDIGVKKELYGKVYGKGKVNLENKSSNNRNTK